jgi:hypothetical protein
MDNEKKIEGQGQFIKTRIRGKSNNALNHDRPHLQSPLVRGRPVLQEKVVVCQGKMRS